MLAGSAPAAAAHISPGDNHGSGDPGWASETLGEKRARRVFVFLGGFFLHFGNSNIALVTLTRHFVSAELAALGKGNTVASVQALGSFLRPPGALPSTSAPGLFRQD